MSKVVVDSCQNGIIIMSIAVVGSCQNRIMKMSKQSYILVKTE